VCVCKGRMRRTTNCSQFGVQVKTSMVTVLFFLFFFAIARQQSVTNNDLQTLAELTF